MDIHKDTSAAATLRCLFIYLHILNALSLEGYGTGKLPHTVFENIVMMFW
jgi:hypothetical protein